jgi:hypothetical protein
MNVKSSSKKQKIFQIKSNLSHTLSNFLDGAKIAIFEFYV